MWILTGEIVKSYPDSIDFSNTVKRNWNMYVNDTYAIAARNMTVNDNLRGKEENLKIAGASYWEPVNPMAGSNVWWMYNADGTLYAYGGNSCCGIRPVVTLKQEVKIIGGSGTEIDPWKLLISGQNS